VLAVPWFTARSPKHVNTRADPAAIVSLASIVIVMELVEVVEARSVLSIVTPPSVPVHVGVCPLTQMALAPPAVNVIVPLAVISVVGVAFSTIFDGVSATVVSSTSPSITVIGVTESYVAALLVVKSVLETPVVEIVVIVAG